MTTERVVITGLGTVNPLSHDVEGFWDALMDGRSGIDYITKFDVTDYASHIGGAVKDWKIPEGTVEHRAAKRMDLVSQYAVVSGIEAVRDSGLDFDTEDRSRCATIIGSGIGGLQELETQHERLMKGGPKKLSPFTVPKLMANASSGLLAIHYGLQGPNFAVVTACASATHAIGEAYRILQRGECDIAVTGGTEAALTKIGLASFCALRGLSTRNDDPAHASRPWDKDRDGFLLAEGAGCVVLETLDHANARGAKIYGELIGYGASCDAYHITAPDPSGRGASDAMQRALDDGKINGDQVDYINAHGTSTELGDIAETNAIKKVFGEYATNGLMVSSTKSQTGHLLGASGGVELIACCKALETDVLPATRNHDSPGEHCDLDVIPNTPREIKADIILSNSFGFGGHNGCLLVQRFQG
jgi:3-oxoacyl-[acyl-carrier-protein] synthase II